MYAIISKSNLECICLVIQEEDGIPFGDNFILLNTGNEKIKTPGLDIVDGVSVYVPGRIFTQEEINAYALNGIIEKRDKLILETAWTVMEDSPLNQMQKNMWKTYRKLLWNIDKTSANPLDITFPKQPGE